MAELRARGGFRGQMGAPHGSHAFGKKKKKTKETVGGAKTTIYRRTGVRKRESAERKGGCNELKSCTALPNMTTKKGNAPNRLKT